MRALHPALLITVIKASARAAWVWYMAPVVGQRGACAPLRKGCPHVPPSLVLRGQIENARA